MKDVRITSLEHYIGEITGFSDVYFYRGVSDVKYHLIPSAGRFGIASDEAQVQFEQNLLRDFMRKAPIYIQSLPKNDLEWMILAQHHGIPTRLLDWSFNPLVALFFAAENDSGSDCAVYTSFPFSGMSNPPDFDAIFSNGEFTPIVPNFTQQRYINQESLFTLHSQPGRADTSKVLKRYLISKVIKQDLRWKLRRMGITKAFIYPSLDSLSYDILQVNKMSYSSYFAPGN